MYATPTTPERARWKVMWMSKGRVITKDFGDDFSEAVRVYTLAVKADKQGATIASSNMTFPPPDKYADSEPVYKIGKSGRPVVDKTTREPIQVGTQVILPRTYIDTMGKLNSRGVWWCPICVKLRKFERFDGFETEGVVIEEPVMMCPMCNISHNHGSVRKYNPAARVGAGRRTRSDKGYSRG